MKHTIYKAMAVVVVAMTALTASAQEALRSAYFLPGYNFRHELNPALAPERGYVAIPALGGLNIGLNSNIGLSTFLYPVGGGRLTTFMSPTVGTDEFLGKLKDRNHFTQSASVNLLSFGFRGFGGYNTVGISVRESASLVIPKDMLAFMKRGMTGPSTHYNFKDLGINANVIGEIAFGHSRAITKDLRVGAKVKVLLGGANVNARISDMDITLSDQIWQIKAQGEMAIAAGKGLRVPTKYELGKESASSPDANMVEWGDIDYDSFGMSGFGLGFDLGATYQLLPNLELSAAVLDFGMMSWNNVIKGQTPSTTWTFDGFQDIAVDSSDPNYEENKLGNQFEKLGDDMEECLNFHRTETGAKRTTGLGTTISVGAAYTAPVWKGLVGGLLLTQRIDGMYSWTEGRISANIIPCGWFDLSANYALSSFGSSLGWVINFHPAGFNLFLGSDYQFFKVTEQYIPVSNVNFNVQFGINFTFGKRKRG